MQSWIGKENKKFFQPYTGDLTDGVKQVVLSVIEDTPAEWSTKVFDVNDLTMREQETAILYTYAYFVSPHCQPDLHSPVDIIVASRHVNNDMLLKAVSKVIAGDTKWLEPFILMTASTSDVNSNCLQSELPIASWGFLKDKGDTQFFGVNQAFDAILKRMMAAYIRHFIVEAEVIPFQLNDDLVSDVQRNVVFPEN